MSGAVLGTMTETLARAVFADVVAGLYTPDEISDGRVVGARAQ